MGVQVIRANVTHEEGQKLWDRFSYLMSLGINEYVQNGGDLSILDRRGEMTFEEWYDYVRNFKEKEKRNK